MKLQETKIEYRNILEVTIKETVAIEQRFPQLPLYSSILNQLLAIEREIVLNEQFYTKEMIMDKFSLGAIAVNNFDSDNDPYAEKLMYIFGLSYKYLNLPEDSSH